MFVFISLLKGDNTNTLGENRQRKKEKNAAKWGKKEIPRQFDSGGVRLDRVR